jgi:hypothetical protein
MFLSVWNDCQQQHDQDVFFSHVAAGEHRALGRNLVGMGAETTQQAS